MIERRATAKFLLAIAFLLTGIAGRMPAFGMELADAPQVADEILPKGADGHPLNLDFERGTLDDWTSEGSAFQKQPIRGNVVTQRRSDMASDHAGEYWIGGFEIAGDQPRGTLRSAPFEVTHRWASYRSAGGGRASTRVELVLHDSNKVFYARAAGHESENLKPVVVDLDSVKGKQIFIRLVDDDSGPWGHLNFDDFKLHTEKPEFADALPQLNVLDEYPFSGLSPADAAKNMLVPEGFHVKLFAGEPDVKQPIAMALDDRGRLWIAEAYNYPIRAPEGQGKDRILIFEDTDGDGHFDSRKVFIDNLNLVSGIEIGFGGVWVGAAPYLLFIPDKNGDDQPDGPPQALLDGWAWQDTHETLNTFIWGPDGWLYGCHGVFTHSNVGKPGASDADRKRINAGIWRYHPTKHLFEVFAEGTSNPWGVDFDDFGQSFCTACVIPHLYHIIQGARYERQAGEHFNPYTYDDIRTIARHRHWIGETPHSGNSRSDAAGGGHAHAGAMIYLGGSWPAKYRNQIFMNNIHGQRINQDLLIPEGSGYAGDRAPDFCLTQDSWSQILNLRYGPDGQAYMIDWYDANACHHNREDGHDRSNGRIFKVCYQNAKPTQVDLRKLPSEKLVELQLETNDWYVRHARRLLQERGPDARAHAALTKIAQTHADPTRRLRALWCLHVSGGFTSAVAMQAMRDVDPRVRGWVAQLATEAGVKLSADVGEQFVHLAKGDPSPVVRLNLASAAQRLDPALRQRVLRNLVTHAEDATDHNLPLMYWYALEPMIDVLPAESVAIAAASPITRLLEFTVRKIASSAKPEGLAMLVAQLGKSSPAAQLTILRGVNTAFKGRRHVDMPTSWQEAFTKLSASDNADIRREATALALTFGDATALSSLRALAQDEKTSTDIRRQAIESLLGFKDPQLAQPLLTLLGNPELRGAALRGLAAYDAPETPAAVLKIYDGLSLAEKRDALNTLAARKASALVLLGAVGSKQIAATDLSADLIRQLRNHKSAEIDQLIGEVWGAARETAADKAALVAKYKEMLSTPAPEKTDVAVGRAIFTKTCQQCHTLFGVGGKVGPELTGSNRANLDYLLSNVLDPSAVMAKEYQPTIATTTDGRVITGIVKSQNAVSLTIQTANELLIVPRDEIDEMQVSSQSMMPEDLLKPLNEVETRSLVAYLASPTQTSLAATPDNVKLFFNGHDLTGWVGAAGLWNVENGELVGRTLGLDHNEFLKSELSISDFRLEVEVKLVKNEGNSGIQFRSKAVENGEVQGYQADVGPGWWGKLYEELGRAILWDRSGEAHVKPGEWNRYVIEARGSQIRTWINGQLCVDLDDPSGARSGIFALQLHSGGATEVRFRDFKLEMLR